MVRSTIVKRISATSALPLLLALTQSGSFAAAAEPTVATTDPCVAYAQANAEGNWMCVGGIMTDTDAGGEAVVANVDTGSTVNVDDVESLSPEESLAIQQIGQSQPAGTSGATKFTPQAVVDDYHANSSTVLTYGRVTASGFHVDGTVTFEHRVALYNHSATDKEYVTFSQTGGDMYWSLRIRRDNKLSGDDTVFTYPSRKDCQATGRTCSTTEDRYGDGYDRFPYDGKKYFLDAYNYNLYVGGNSYNGLGSAQSDRATCYKTTNCKFKG